MNTSITFQILIWWKSWILVFFSFHDIYMLLCVCLSHRILIKIKNNFLFVFFLACHNVEKCIRVWKLLQGAVWVHMCAMWRCAYAERIVFFQEMFVLGRGMRNRWKEEFKQPERHRGRFKEMIWIQIIYFIIEQMGKKNVLSYLTLAFIRFDFLPLIGYFRSH